MMFETPSPSDTSTPDSVVQGAQKTVRSFDVTLCGQCSTCQSYFPCEHLFVLQIQNDDGYQDTSRLICFECYRSMNLRVYQGRELTRQEMTAAIRHWLAQRHLLSEQTLSR
jgi:hypothetical protein